jgi:hypothetical protein
MNTDLSCISGPKRSIYERESAYAGRYSRAIERRPRLPSKRIAWEYESDWVVGAVWHNRRATFPNGRSAVPSPSPSIASGSPRNPYLFNFVAGGCDLFSPSLSRLPSARPVPHYKHLHTTQTTAPWRRPMRTRRTVAPYTRHRSATPGATLTEKRLGKTEPSRAHRAPRRRRPPSSHVLASSTGAACPARVTGFAKNGSVGAVIA